MPKVIYEKRGPVAYIRLNRPEVKNAIDLETHDLLRAIWTDFGADRDLRVAVLTGTGDAFCAGADLKAHVPEWASVGPALLGYAICGDNQAIRERSQQFFDRTDAGPAGSAHPGGARR